MEHEQAPGFPTSTPFSRFMWLSDYRSTGSPACLLPSEPVFGEVGLLWKNFGSRGAKGGKLCCLVTKHTPSPADSAS